MPIVEVLLAAGTDPNLASVGGPPITIAAWKGHAAAVALLLRHGADANAAFRTETALHSAAEKGALDVVIVLVEAGANVNALTKDREPPIHYAAKKSHDDIVLYFRQHCFLAPTPEPIGVTLASASPDAGAALFNKTCRNCHDASPQMLHFRGPPLWNIVGRARAAHPGTSYSMAMKQWPGVWPYEDLNVFLSDPTRALPGTDMGSPGLQRSEERRDLIAYLSTLSLAPQPFP